MSLFRTIPINTPRRVRPVHVAAFVVVFLFISLSRQIRYKEPLPSIYTYTDGKTSRPWSELVMPVGPSTEALWLRQLVKEHGLSRDLKYYSERIKPFETAERLSVTDLRKNFRLADAKRVRVDEDAIRAEAVDVLELPVGESVKPGETDASHILFGISTTYARVTRSDDALVNDLRMWLTDGKGNTNGASLYLSLYQADDYEIDAVKRKLEKAGIDAYVTSIGEEMDSASRYIDLVGTLAVRSNAQGIGSSEKQWLAVVEDDIFFPNMGQLVELLGKYDHREQTYVGVPSERADWVVDTELSVTYGGGAVFLSPSAAARISQLPCVPRKDSEEEDYGYLGQWDGLLYECISNYTDLNMHVLPSYYTPSDETRGTNSLTYELGIAPLSMHRPSNRHGFRNVGKAAFVSTVCGEACFLQRYRFRDNWILVNGHSIAQFPNGQDLKPLGKEVASEYQQAMNEYHAAITMPLELNIIVDDEWRKPDEWKVVTWAESKRTWKFLDSVMSEDGEVWQAYVRRKGETGLYTDGRVGDFAGEDSVIVLIWEKARKREGG